MAKAADAGGAQLFSATSPGVLRIQKISSVFTTWHKALLFFGIFLVAYAYGLDSSSRYTFQGYATAAFRQHSLLATVSTVRSIVAAASQPAFARISDVFGRISILVFCTLIYVIGTIVEATAKNVSGFSGGALLYQFGFTGIILLVEILIADTTTLRNRLLFSYIPAIPFLINAWISGNVTEAIIAGSTWVWGIAMWAIIFPACALLLLFSLWNAERRAKKQGLLEGIPSPWRSFLKKDSMIELFWQVDVIGLILLAASLALILLPFTLAGGETLKWREPQILATLIVGFVVALPGFIFYEKKFAKHPVIPFHLLKERTVVAGLFIAMFLNASWYLQGDYLYAQLLVGFNQSVKSATRISNIYSFTSTCVGLTVGLAVRYLRRLKMLILFGTVVYTSAFGVLIFYRGGASSTGNIKGMIAGQFLLGFGGGFFPYGVQALVQAATKHEHVAVITALYLATYNVGSSIGFTISGAIWTQTLYSKLTEQLGPINMALVADVYADPYTFVDNYPWGTPERMAVVAAYSSLQRLLCITGLCMSLVIIIAAVFLKDFYLVDAQSRPEAEGQAGQEDGSEKASFHSDNKQPLEEEGDASYNAARKV